MSTEANPDHTVEVFRRLYAAVGFGLLVWPTRLRLTGCCKTDTCKVG